MLVRPKWAFISEATGFPQALTTNDILEDDDPIVRDRPDMFEPIAATVSSRPPVETTRAEPEMPRRGPGRPRKVQ